MRELATLILQLQALTDRLVVAMLPESSAHRALMPDVAAQYLVDTVISAGPHPPEIIDVRDTMPDAWFVDSYHLTMTGRRALSELLGKKLAE